MPRWLGRKAFEELVAELERLMRGGMSYEDAMKQLIEKKKQEGGTNGSR